MNDLGVRQLTAGQLDAIASTKAGVIGRLIKGARRDETVSLVTLVGGWRVTWVDVDPDDKGSGKLVLVSTNSRTKSLLKAGIIKSWIEEYGFEPQEAARIWNIKAHGKLHLIKELSIVLKDPELEDIFLEHTSDYKQQEANNEWFMKYRDKLPFRMAKGRFTTLAFLVKQVHVNATRYKTSNQRAVVSFSKRVNPADIEHVKNYLEATRYIDDTLTLEKPTDPTIMLNGVYIAINDNFDLVIKGKRLYSYDAKRAYVDGELTPIYLSFYVNNHPHWPT